MKHIAWCLEGTRDTGEWGTCLYLRSHRSKKACSHEEIQLLGGGVQVLNAVGK